MLNSISTIPTFARSPKRPLNIIHAEVVDSTDQNVISSRPQRIRKRPVRLQPNETVPANIEYMFEEVKVPPTTIMNYLKSQGWTIEVSRDVSMKLGTDWTFFTPEGYHLWKNKQIDKLKIDINFFSNVREALIYFKRENPGWERLFIPDWTPIKQNLTSDEVSESNSRDESSNDEMDEIFVKDDDTEMSQSSSSKDLNKSPQHDKETSLSAKKRLLSKPSKKITPHKKVKSVDTTDSLSTIPNVTYNMKIKAGDVIYYQFAINNGGSIYHGGVVKKVYPSIQEDSVNVYCDVDFFYRGIKRVNLNIEDSQGQWMKEKEMADEAKSTYLQMKDISGIDLGDGESTSDDEDKKPVSTSIAPFKKKVPIKVNSNVTSVNEVKTLEVDENTSNSYPYGTGIRYKSPHLKVESIRSPQYSSSSIQKSEIEVETNISDESIHPLHQEFLNESQNDVEYHYTCSEIAKICDHWKDNLRSIHVWGLMGDTGWKLASCNFLSNPRYSTCYIAPWAEKIYEDRSLDRSKILLCGRDYFFENEDWITYIKKFGNRFNAKGITVGAATLSRRQSLSLSQPSTSQENKVDDIDHREEIINSWIRKGHITVESCNAFIGMFI